MSASLPPDVVAQAVLNSLRQQTGQPWELAAPAELMLYMPWSTLYLIQVRGAAKLVVKIVHFPDQTTPEISWQSEELIIRGKREYNSLVTVYEHFNQQPDKNLCSLPVKFYLPELNAIVMDFVEGQALYQAYFSGLKLLNPAQQKRTAAMMERAGQWLHWLHQLPLNEPEQSRISTPAATFKIIQSESAILKSRGVDLTLFPQWEKVYKRLSEIQETPYVWTHGDFHLRNLMVLPEERLMGLDTALESVDSPYYDIGKFTAGMKTRKQRILSLRLLPSDKVISRMTDAFLNGYFQGKAYDKPLFLLYEGRFFLEKWNEMLEVAQRVPFPPARIALVKVINTSFNGIMKQWMEALV